MAEYFSLDFLEILNDLIKNMEFPFSRHIFLDILPNFANMLSRAHMSLLFYFYTNILCQDH
jgi:hypothetical protein